jgi:hypothetical protein
MCRSSTKNTLKFRGNVLIAKDSADSGFLKENVKTLPTTQSNSNGKKSSSSPSPSPLIRFNLDDLQVHHIPCRDDLSRDELVDMWYSKDDYLDMKRREKRIIKKISTVANTNNNNSHSIFQQVLGLKTKKELIERTKMIRHCQLLVLTEQERLKRVSSFQKYQNSTAEVLAQVYQGMSQHALQAARNRGLTVEVLRRNLDLIHDEPRQEYFLSDAKTSTMRHRRWSAMGSSTDTSTNQEVDIPLCCMTQHLRNRPIIDSIQLNVEEIYS